MMLHSIPLTKPFAVSSGLFLCLTVLILSSVKSSYQQYLPAEQYPLTNIKTEPFYLDIFYKFDLDKDFKQRGSILVKPKVEHRPAQATFVQHNELQLEDLERFKEAYQGNENYILKAVFRPKKPSDSQHSHRYAQTVVKFCSLYVTNLTDTLVVNLNPLNEFISVNLYTTEPECLPPVDSAQLKSKFNTKIVVDTGIIGPQPDTVTYIKRLEEERINKLKEGKEDNRGFFAKYWMYILPAVILLMMMGGPEAQGAR